MTRRHLVLLAVSWTTSIALISAQSPDFAGKWTFVSGWSMSVSDGKPVKVEITAPAGPLGSSGSIAQDDRQLTFTPASEGAQKTVCNLSSQMGASSVGKAASVCRGSVKDKSILLMGLQRSVNDTMTVSTTRLSLDAEGRLLIVISGPSELGHPGPIGTLVYKRSVANR